MNDIILILLLIATLFILNPVWKLLCKCCLLLLYSPYILKRRLLHSYCHKPETFKRWQMQDEMILWRNLETIFLVFLRLHTSTNAPIKTGLVFFKTRDKPLLWRKYISKYHYATQGLWKIIFRFQKMSSELMPICYVDSIIILQLFVYKCTSIWKVILYVFVVAR